jgi:hypothetical protein
MLWSMQIRGACILWNVYLSGTCIVGNVYLIGTCIRENQRERVYIRESAANVYAGERVR